MVSRTLVVGLVAGLGFACGASPDDGHLGTTAAAYLDGACTGALGRGAQVTGDLCVPRLTGLATETDYSDTSVAHARAFGTLAERLGELDGSLGTNQAKAAAAVWVVQFTQERCPPCTVAYARFAKLVAALRSEGIAANYAVVDVNSLFDAGLRTAMGVDEGTPRVVLLRKQDGATLDITRPTYDADDHASGEETVHAPIHYAVDDDVRVRGKAAGSIADADLEARIRELAGPAAPIPREVENAPNPCSGKTRGFVCGTTQALANPSARVDCVCSTMAVPHVRARMGEQAKSMVATLADGTEAACVKRVEPVCGDRIEKPVVCE